MLSYNKEYFYHSFILITLNLLRKEAKGIGGARKKTNAFVQKSLNCESNFFNFFQLLIKLFQLILKNPCGSNHIAICGFIKFILLCFLVFVICAGERDVLIFQSIPKWA